ncbi:TldD/PmbA family protein [Kitasatospora sp. NPDC093550]|uniref:TldD/PmbA family protein n=1 Tax=Kitasatospora sp. NPDC093550 TaxID=3364089 RepID=UPI0038128EC8
MIDQRPVGAGPEPELYTSATRRFAAALVQDGIDELSAATDRGTALRYPSERGGQRHEVVTGNRLPAVPPEFRDLAAGHQELVEAGADAIHEGAVAPAAAVDLAVRIRDSARRACADIGFVQVRVEEFAQHMTVSRPGLSPRGETRRWVRLVVRTTAGRDGVTRTASLLAAAPDWDELVRGAEQRCPGRRAAEAATGLLTAHPLPDGELPVVFAGATAATFVHEVCGHVLEGDLLADRRSLLAGLAGAELATGALTVSDDPRIAGRWGSYTVDDEGSEAVAVTLIEAGRLAGQITCRASADRLGVRATGHGRRADYQRPPLPRLTNTVVQAGPERPDALLSGIGHGVLVTEVAGGHVNPMTGDFTVQVAAARAIRAGRPAETLGAGVIRGNVRTALAGIGAVADDVAVVDSVCVKRGQRMPVSFSSPSLLVEQGLQLSGGRP